MEPVKMIIEIGDCHPNEPAILAKAKTQLRTRIKNAGFEDIKVLEKENVFSISTQVEKGNKEDLYAFESLGINRSVAISPVFRISDKEVQNISRKIPRMNCFAHADSLSTLPVLGISTNQDSLEYIKEVIEKALLDYPNLSLKWKKSIVENTKEPIWDLVMINKEASIENRITNKNIISTELVLDHHGIPALWVYLDEKGSDIFSKLTKTAVINGNRELAIVIDDEVISIPAVHEQIKAGKFMIYGDYSIEDLERMRHSLRHIPIDCDLKQTLVKQ